MHDLLPLFCAIALVAAEESGICEVVPSLSRSIVLNNGKEVSRIGLGTAGLGEGTEAAVSQALKVGYRHLDTAQAWEWYREKSVGDAIRAVLRQPGQEGLEGGLTQAPEGTGEVGGGGGTGLTRGDVFVTTKLHPRDHAREAAKQKVQDSRKALQVLLDMAEVPPAMVQNWMDPFHQDRAVRQLCAKNGIAYTSYSTLGGQWVYRSSPPGPNPVSTSPTLQAIAKAHGDVSVQAVVLSWALQEGAVVLPRSTNASHMLENLQVFQTGERPGEGDIAVFLTDVEMDAIRALDGSLD